MHGLDYHRPVDNGRKKAKARCSFARSLLIMVVLGLIVGVVGRFFDYYDINVVAEKASNISTTIIEEDIKPICNDLYDYVANKTNLFK